MFSARCRGDVVTRVSRVEKYQIKNRRRYKCVGCSFRSSSSSSNEFSTQQCLEIHIFSFQSINSWRSWWNVTKVHCRRRCKSDCCGSSRYVMCFLEIQLDNGPLNLCNISPSAKDDIHDSPPHLGNRFLLLLLLSILDPTANCTALFSLQNHTTYLKVTRSTDQVNMTGYASGVGNRRQQELSHDGRTDGTERYVINLIFGATTELRFESNRGNNFFSGGNTAWWERSLFFPGAAAMVTMD